MRLPIDRAFTLRGIGTVVTGTLVGTRWPPATGRADARRRRCARALRPGPRRAGRARPGRPARGRRPGGASSGTRFLAERASSTPGALPESYRLDVDLRALAGGPGVAQGALVQVLIGTACVDARVALLEEAALAAGSTGLAQLRLRELVAAARGDRVIVRTTAPQATIAGGVVLDPAPSRHGGTRHALDRLRLLAGGDAPSLVRAALRAAPWPLALSADRAARGATGSCRPRRAGRVRVRIRAEVLAWPERRPRGSRRRATTRCAAPRWNAARAARRRKNPPRARAPRACRRPARPRRGCAARAPRQRRRAAARRRARAARGRPRRRRRLPRGRGGGPARGTRRRRLHAARPADAAGRLRAARARVHGALRRARAQREARALRRRPGLHERALRPGARARGRALHASESIALAELRDDPAPAGASPRACSSGSTPTA